MKEERENFSRTSFDEHIGCVWFRREVVKREKSEREYEKREICEK